MVQGRRRTNLHQKASPKLINERAHTQHKKGEQETGRECTTLKGTISKWIALEGWNAPQPTNVARKEMKETATTTTKSNNKNTQNKTNK